ncbi:MAG: hypothetical protein PHR53_00790 [Bacteroidales bacterium]|nr:hypothetical protein [Bacteroidales bacterium]
MPQQKFQKLREDYPVFIYETFHWTISEHQLAVTFRFSVGDFCFEPQYLIPIPDSFSLTTDMLENLIFHLGLCETISYWKATCSPRLKICPYRLNPTATKWWKKLFYNGLGEFRYLNGINCSEEDFVNFEFETTATLSAFSDPSNQGVLIPIGGGKDSAVTLELLKKIDFTKYTFTLNEIPAAKRTRIQAGYASENHINVQRKLSPQLLKMNEEGFLNGHTPFSALLAFVTTLVASIYRLRYITLSNESSANESTIAGTNINHQYSKTIDFEQDFRDYAQRFITPDVEYFSFLRPISESEIARLFSRFSQHHATFRSCNRGSKKDEWCGKCSKCLFVWIILSPYLSTKALAEIFGRNLENDSELMDDFQKLTGIAAEKPFECIGTIDEVQKSIVDAYQNNHHQGYLYQYFMEQKIVLKPSKSNDTSSHFLPFQFLQILKQALHE